MVSAMTRDYPSARNYEGSPASDRWGYASPSEVREAMYSRPLNRISGLRPDPLMSVSEYREFLSGRY